MNMDFIDAVRDILVADATLIALVPAAQIITAEGSLPTVYPAITLSEDTIEDGNDYNMEGLFYLTMYTQNTKHFRALHSIHKVVFPLIGRNGSALDITNANVTVHEFRQVFAGVPIHEPDVDINTWGLATHYACKVTI